MVRAGTTVDHQDWRSKTIEPPYVTNLVENFMDVPHTVFVHAGWFRKRGSTRVPTSVERTRDSVLVTYDHPKDSIGWSTLILNQETLEELHCFRSVLCGSVLCHLALPLCGGRRV